METENDGCDLSECKPSITLVDSCGREFFTNLLPRDMEFLIKYSILMKAKQELAEEALYGPSKKKLRDEKVKLKERKIKVEEVSPEIPLPKQILRIAKGLLSPPLKAKRVPKPNRKYLGIPGPIPVDETAPPESPEWESIDFSTTDIPPRLSHTFLGTVIPPTTSNPRGSYKPRKNKLSQQGADEHKKPLTLLDSLRCDEVLDFAGNGSDSLSTAFENSLSQENGQRGIPPTAEDHNYATKIPRTMKLSKRQAGAGINHPPLPIPMRIPKVLKPKPLPLTRREGKRGCRKVYGIEHVDQWCRHCQWKKACTRFGREQQTSEIPISSVPPKEPKPPKPNSSIERKLHKRNVSQLMEADRKKVEEEIKTEEAVPATVSEVKSVPVSLPRLAPKPFFESYVLDDLLDLDDVDLGFKRNHLGEITFREKAKIPLLIPLTLEAPDINVPQHVTAPGATSSNVLH